MGTRTINKWGEGQRLREEITQAARRLLGRATSRDTVTLRAIAREAGIAAPSIYKRFSNRDAVLDAVVSSTFDQLATVCEDAFHRGVTGAERVRAISRAYVAFAVEHPSEYRILFERSADNREANPRPYPAGIRAFRSLIDAVEQMGAEGTSNGHDPMQSAEALWAALHGAVTLIPATPGFPWSPISVIVETLIAGVVGDEGS